MSRALFMHHVTSSLACCASRCVAAPSINSLAENISDINLYLSTPVPFIAQLIVIDNGTGQRISTIYPQSVAVNEFMRES